MNRTSIFLILETLSVDPTVESIYLTDRTSNLEFSINRESTLIQIKTKISLPNLLHIHHQGNLFLKEFWIGGIKSSPSMLKQIFLYTPQNSANVLITQSWHLPGTTKIELFDPSFIEYHLHYYNNSKH